jgi:hypothetical protein
MNGRDKPVPVGFPWHFLNWTATNLEVAMDSNNSQKGLETRDRDTEIKERTARVRAAVKELVDASFDWWNEIEDALAGLPREERLAFVEEAGRACGALGNYVAKAAEAEGAQT